MSRKSIASMLAVYFIAITSYAFMVIMPNWCANPNVGGNSIVQPLC